MNSQYELESSSKKNLVWTTEMDNYLTESLIEQMQKGNKIDRSFTNLAYQAACDDLFAKCGIRATVIHLKNRLKTLKKDLAAFQDIDNFGSGFAFNKVTRMMDAEPKVWDNYIQAHPEGKQYRHKAVPSFENLQLLFGKDRANGMAAETAKEKRRRLERERDESSSTNVDQEVNHATEQEGDEESIGPTNLEPQEFNAQSTLPSRSKVTFKRKYGASSTTSEDFMLLKSGMESVVSALTVSAPRVHTEEKLFEEVLKIEGLDEDSQLLAYDYLCGDAVRGRTFVGLPIFRRKRWLEIKLGW